MPNDPFYSTPKWQRLRAAVLKRARGRCEIEGCKDRACIVDHITSRRNGGSDTMGNLRALCRDHDNQLKEDATGQRRSGGKAVVKGCDVNGYPLDPNHPWNLQQ